MNFLSKLQSELENLSFMYTNTQEYEKITERVAELYEEHEKELTEVISPCNFYSLVVSYILLNLYCIFSCRCHRLLRHIGGSIGNVIY